MPIDVEFAFAVGEVVDFRVAAECGDTAKVVVVARSAVQYGRGPFMPSYRVAWVDDRERRTAEVWECELS
jgi:hypothetical protein